MSQPARPESDTSARPQENAPQQVAQEARGRLATEANTIAPATGLNDKVCGNQPEAGQIPVLRAGEKTNGCNFQSFDRDGNNQSMPPFNTGELYRQAQSQSARVIGEKGHGTGVAIAKTDDTCYIATAGHNIESGRQGGGPVRGAEFNNGKTYPASLAMRDKPNESAIIAVRTGADTNQVCNPATFAENPAAKGPGIIAGYPMGVNRLHASPGDTTGMGTFRQLNGHRHDDPMKGENVNRPLLAINAQVHHGNSGGPAYNDRGEVRGLVSGAHTRRPREEAHITPISRGQMQEYLNKLGLVR